MCEKTLTVSFLKLCIIQENNAIAEINCRRKGKCEIVRIKGLGFKDFNLPGNGFDASDEDGRKYFIAVLMLRGIDIIRNLLSNFYKDVPQEAQENKFITRAS